MYRYIDPTQVGVVGPVLGEKLTTCSHNALKFHVKPEEAKALIDTMKHTVNTRWYAIARTEGVTEQDCERIKEAFAYEGSALTNEQIEALLPWNADQTLIDQQLT
ncbi:MAG: hypothetical protein GXP16_09030 [Gammaproteobacteria bacterium]|nr:hypothetical protein [Gammaproteobacteria bacterium]